MKMEKKKCRGRWRKWREENCDENGEKKNAENGKNGERKTLMRLRVKKEREEGEDFIMDVHVVLGVDQEEEVLGEDLMRKIRILLKTRGLLKRLKRRLTL